MMGPHGPGAKLVDREGFPIQGVDIHGVLDVRHKIACTYPFMTLN